MEISIPTFVNPHLFWVLDRKKKQHVKQIEQKLTACLQDTFPSRKHFLPNQIAAVVIDDVFRRIVIKSVEIDDNTKKRIYFGWLLDYGTMVKTEILYELPEDLEELEAVVKQAALKDVGYVVQRLVLGVTGEIIFLPTEVPTLAVRVQSSLLISKSNTLRFKIDKESNGILIGDLILANNKSLTKTLLDANLLCHDERLYNRIMNNLEIFKTTHLRQIYQICEHTRMTTPEPKKDAAKELIKNLGIEAEDEVQVTPQMELSASRRKHLMRRSNLSSPDSDYNQDKSFESSSSAVIENDNELEKTQNINEEKKSVELEKIKSGSNTKLSKRAQALLEKSRITLKLSEFSDTESVANKEPQILIDAEPSPNSLDVVSCKRRLAEYMKNRRRQTVSPKNPEGLDNNLDVASSIGDSVSISDVQFDSSTESASLLEEPVNKAEQEGDLEGDKEAEDDKEAGEEEQAEEEAEQEEVKPPTPPPPKRKFPKNSMFMPAGGESSCQLKKPRINLKHSTNIRRKNDREIAPSDSDCPTVSIRKSDIKTSEEKSGSKSSEDTENDKETSGERIENCRLQNIPYRGHKCECKQCTRWTDADEWGDTVNFEDVGSKESPTLIIRPPLLLKTDGEDGESGGFKGEILSLDFSNMSKVQKMYAAKLLVHGESIPSPIENVAYINISPDIHRNIHEMKYLKAKRIQVYAWPALTRNQHVVMIGDVGTGKTMAYLPILCSFIHEKNERYSQLFKMKMGGGPIVVILCNTSNKCEEIYDMTKLVFKGLRSRVLLMTYPNEHVNTSRSDILITMPTVLGSLLQSRAINLKRLCHFVLEDGYSITTNHGELLNKFFNVIQKVLTTRLCAKSVQLVICSERWTTQIENICKKLDKLPFICIGNYLEAALYGKMQLTMKFLNTALKEQELRNLLGATFNYTKSVIICNNEEIEEIQTILMLKGIEYTAIKDEEDKETMLYLEEVWNNSKPGDHTVLICSDYVFDSMLSINSASLLIHYSLPTNSWTKFCKRFSCLLRNCASPLDSRINKTPIRSVVFIDENCEKVMLRFSNFLNISGLTQHLPDNVKVYFKELQDKVELDKIKKKVQLCPRLKILGTCAKYECEHRHILDNNLDIEQSNLPRNGKIKFRICEMNDVTTFTIKLLEHYDLDNNLTVKYQDKTPEINDGLMANAKKILSKPCTKPVVDHLYSYLDETNYLYRCRVLNIDKHSISIKLIDMGCTSKILLRNPVTMVLFKSSQLFYLPSKFKEMPEQAHEVYMANLVPPHNDENFSAKSFRLLQFVYDKVGISTMTMTANIHLQLGNNLWLKHAEEERKLFDKTLPTRGFQLDRELAEKHFAIKDEKQLKHLYGLCKNAEIELPLYELARPKLVKDEVQVQPQWAFLDMDRINEVVFSSAMSPDEIYVKLEAYIPQLDQLTIDIQEDLQKPFYPNVGTITVGKCYLLKDPAGNQYSRVIVRQIENDRALCFFVDYGDEVVVDFSELKHIKNHFISRLPFQSIQCGLHGVKPVNLDGTWSNETTAVLYEYSCEPGSDIFRQLYVKPCRKEENREIERQKRYSVLLKDGFGEQKIINQLLIDCGLALGDRGEVIKDFELPKTEKCGHDEEMEVIDGTMDDVEIENGQIIPFNLDLNGLGDFEVNILNPEELLTELTNAFFGHNADKQCTPKRESNNNPTSSSRDLPRLKAAPPVDYCTPDVLWSQTENVVKLTIKIPDVRDYNIAVVKNMLFTFSTVKNDNHYKLKLMLFESVAKTFQHTAVGQQVRVTLTKMRKGVEWSRLLITKEKARNIRYDVGAIQVPEEKKRKFLELPFKDSDSEKEDEAMYVVSSDMDSEYDEDIPNCD